MAEQIRQQLDVLDAAGNFVFINFEVLDDSGGNLACRDDQHRIVLQFRPATLTIGAEGNAGEFLVRDQQGQVVFKFNASNAGLGVGVIENPADVAIVGTLRVRDLSDREVLLFDSTNAKLTVGELNNGGVLVVKDSLGQSSLNFGGSSAELRIGNLQNPGELLIRDGENRPVLFFDSSLAQLRIGDLASDGEFILLDQKKREVMRFQGKNGTFSLGTEDNGGTLVIKNFMNRNAFVFDTGQGESSPLFDTGASARIGTRDASGTLMIHDSQDREAFKFTGDDAELVIGASGNSGQLVVLHAEGEPAMIVNSKSKPLGEANPNQPPEATIVSTALVRIGGRRVEGVLEVDDGEGRSALRFDSGGAANLRIGSQDREGRLVIKDSQNKETFSFEADKALLHIGSGGEERIVVDGKAGDILFKNADVAERFTVANRSEAAPGTVMVLGADGRLQPCAVAYDRHVVGVVAAAGHRRPGIVLDAGTPAETSAAISVFGKACCKADATSAPITVGDLLTTSGNPGHAMKVADPQRAFGAVIGKALSSLPAGTGTIELLVALH